METLAVTGTRSKRIEEGSIKAPGMPTAVGNMLTSVERLQLASQCTF